MATRTVYCATSSGHIIADHFCEVSSRPERERKCDQEGRCVAQWFTGPWGKVSLDVFCSLSCYNMFIIYCTFLLCDLILQRQIYNTKWRVRGTGTFATIGTGVALTEDEFEILDQ